MKLEARSQERIQSFFRLYYRESDLVLPQIELIGGLTGRAITLFARASAMTLGKWIFLSPSGSKRVFDQLSRGRIEGLLIHEAAHVLQYRRQGIGSFLYSYLRSYFVALWRLRGLTAAARLEAYRAIPQEAEAFSVEMAFIEE